MERVLAAAAAALNNVKLDAGLHDTLRRQAELWQAGAQTLAGMQALAQGRAVAVASAHEAALYAGLLSDLIRALTAIKLARELERHGMPSVPFLCVRENGGRDLETQALGLIDARAQFIEIGIDLIRDPEVGGFLISTRAAHFALELEALLGAPFRDPAIPEMLRETHFPGNRLAWAWAGLMSRLLREWGVIVFCLEKTLAWNSLGSLMPVAVVIAQPEMSVSEAQPCPVWPSARMTLADGRSLRPLFRHGLALEDLSDGPDKLVERIFPRDRIGRVMERVVQMKRALGDGFSDLHHRLGPERAPAIQLERASARIQYQLERFWERCSRHYERRREILYRQFARSCNRLFPGGHPQESRLAALQILHEHGRAALSRIYEAMDVRSGAHQLVSLE